MAFENPLLRPSATRQSALRYLWSDEPESTSTPQQQGTSFSIVDNVFGLTESTNTAGNVVGNIANNGGEYNPDDNTDYSAWAKASPIEALKAVQENKGLIKGILSAMGIPMAGSIIAAVEQNAANNVLGLVSGFVSQYGGEVVEDGSLLTAAGKAALPFGIGKLMSSDSVEASKGLVDAFGTTDAMAGYFGAALDPTVGQIVSGMIADPTTITAAQYGTIGQAVRSRIQDNVASGMPLNTAQNEAIDFFAPQAAVSTPITGEVTSGTSFEPVGMLSPESISLEEAPAPAAPQTAFPVTPTPPAQPAVTTPVTSGINTVTPLGPQVDPGIQAAIAQAEAQAAAQAQAAADEAAAAQAAQAAQAQAEAQAAAQAQAEAQAIAQAQAQAQAQAEANAAANAAAIAAAQSGDYSSNSGGDLGTGASDAAGFGGYGGVW
jgi:hypothetical protein